MDKMDFGGKWEQIKRKSKGGYAYRGFVILPHSLLLDNCLPRSCLVVFWVLTMHLFKGSAYCFPAIDTIAKEAHMGRMTAIRCISALEKLGYLEVEKEKGRVNKYYLKAKI